MSTCRALRLEEIRGAVPKKEFRARARWWRWGGPKTTAEEADDAEDAEEVEGVQELADSADEEEAGRRKGVTSGRD